VTEIPSLARNGKGRHFQIKVESQQVTKARMESTGGHLEKEFSQKEGGIAKRHFGANGERSRQGFCEGKQRNPLTATARSAGFARIRAGKHANASASAAPKKKGHNSVDFCRSNTGTLFRAGRLVGR